CSAPWATSVPSCVSPAGGAAGSAAAGAAAPGCSTTVPCCSASAGCACATTMILVVVISPAIWSHLHALICPGRGARGRAFRSSRSDCVEQQEGDNEREDAQRFGHGEAEDQVRELTRGRRRVAQRTRQVVTEDHAHAHTGAAHADARDTGTDQLCSICF